MNDIDDDDLFRGEYVDFAELDRSEMQSKLLELLTLVETSRELLRANDADDMSRRVLLSAIGVLGASSACVLMLGESRDHLVLRQQFGLDVDDGASFAVDPQLVDAFERNPSARPFRTDEQLAQGAAASFVHNMRELLHVTDASVIAPLHGRSQLLGLFVLGRRLLAEGYGSRDLELFASLSELYSLAMERKASPAPAVRPKRPSSGATEALATPVNVGGTLEAELDRLRNQYPPLREILGGSAALLRLFKDLVAFADSRATILIQGESGTGKELVAKAIHNLSRRRNRPLEIVDCSSIPKELIESELFGHVRGSFTGAVRDRRGAFELAHTGTLFLDEIGEMTLSSQTRLLRVLQEGKFRPVGGEKTQSVDVRFIAATNVDLREAVQRGDFRKDLFYRIQVFPLRLPPLRERLGDIELLTRAFLKRFCADEGRPQPAIEEPVLERLLTHSFPGNVRELQNMAEALAIRSRNDGIVRLAHLEDVWRSQRLPTRERMQAAAAEPRAESAPTPSTTSLSTTQSTGQLALAAWRQSGFNLLEASRQLRARRTDGERIGVVDRAQLSHYLDGEILKAFHESGSLSLCLDRLTAGHRHAHRGAKRVERVLHELVDAVEAERDVFPRLPEEYRDSLLALRKLGPRWLRKRLRKPTGGPSLEH